MSRMLVVFSFCLGLQGVVTLAFDKPESKIWTEVVVSHYSEDLGWISDHANPDTVFTVYSKADGGIDIPAGAGRFVRLPNVGREGHTYLHHIVENYNRLAPWTVFKQGSSPAQGYIPTERTSGHFNSDTTLNDYIQPFPQGRDSMFVMTAAAHFPSGLQLTRPGLAINGLEHKPMSTSMCPQKWTPWWLEELHIYNQKFEPSMLEFYDRFVARSNSPSNSLMLAFPQGGIFAVSRDRIHARPREYYSSLLEQVKKEMDPIQGYWLEASWYDIFHPESLQSQHLVCEYPTMPARESVAPYGDMFNLWVRDAIDDNTPDSAALRKLVVQDGPSSVKAPSSGPSSIKPPSSAPSSVHPPSSTKNSTVDSNVSSAEAFANLTESEAGTIHTGRIAMRFANESDARIFAQSAEAKRIMVEVIAEANPEVEPLWIFIESIEVISARRLESNLQSSASDVNVDYKVFIPLSRTAASFDAQSITGDALVNAVNAKARAVGLNVAVSSASNEVVAVETVGSPASDALSGSVRTRGGAHMIVLAVSVAIASVWNLC